LAATVGRERKLTGIINADDGFQAANSADRLSRPDPERNSTNVES
jgi:hypothetical protein